jgi:hypothetical protein
MKTQLVEGTEVHRGSGNVFADLPSSTPNPDFSPFCATGLNKIKHLQLIF